MLYPISDAGAKLYNGKFTDGIPSQNVDPSLDKAAHMNAVYDEIINAITALGETPTENVNDQLKTGLESLIGTINSQSETSLGSIGSYAFLSRISSYITIVPGEIYPGSSFYYGGIGRANDGDLEIYFYLSGIAPTGSWMAMGSFINNNSYPFSATLFQRVL